VSVARAAYPTSTRRQPAVVAIAGGSVHARRRAARLLAEAGVSVDEPASPDAPEIVLVFLTDVTDRERVGEIRALGETYPDACILTIMPAGVANSSLRRVLVAGATGIVFDEELDRALGPTARSILAGQLTVPAALGRQIAPRPLSHREKQILSLVVLGRTNQEIAQTLYLAESTVKTHLSSAFRKLDARCRAEAVNRLLDPESGYGPNVLETTNESLAAAN
jgi:two-component system, NarL family, response regulator